MTKDSNVEQLIEFARYMREHGTKEELLEPWKMMGAVDEDGNFIPPYDILPELMATMEPSLITAAREQGLF